MSTAAILFRVLLGVSAGLGLLGLVAWRSHERPWAQRVFNAAGAVPTVLGLAAFAARWAEAGHLPLFGVYEAALSLSLVVVATAWGFELRSRSTLGVAPVGAVLSALSLWHGLRYDATPSALTISERSLVMDGHAVVAWAAFGVLAVNAGLSAIILWRPEGERVSAKLVPTLELGFFLHTAMLVSGSLYRFLLFGRAWSFDPIETLGFITWTAYGTLLHMHFFAHWRGRRLAAWSLGLFLLLVVSYRGIVTWPSWSTYHVFDIGLREHLR